LLEPQPDGQTLRRHLEIAAESTGAVPQRLREHGTLPLGYEHLWQWFGQLSRTRSVGLSVGPISYTEVAAWSDLTGNRPTPFEVELLMDMDVLLMASQAQARTKAKAASHG
jgi:hypothetical protein